MHEVPPRFLLRAWRAKLRLGSEAGRSQDWAEEVSARSKRAGAHSCQRAAGQGLKGRRMRGGSLRTAPSTSRSFPTQRPAALGFQPVYELIALCLASQLPASILFVFRGKALWVKADPGLNPPPPRSAGRRVDRQCARQHACALSSAPTPPGLCRSLIHFRAGAEAALSSVSRTP